MYNVTNSSKSNFKFYNDKVSHFNFDHLYLTRGRNDFRVPFSRLSLGQRNVFYQGTKLWNTIPDIFKDCRSIHSFKKNFKKHLILKF